MEIELEIQLKSEVEMKNLGIGKEILGMEIKRDKVNGLFIKNDICRS